jgi:hypothetical protein
MAVTEVLYTGNGSTTLFSFSFPYLNESDVVVTVNGSVVTNYIFASASSIQFATAPANGAAIRIYRDTNTAAPEATFFAGSSIRATDLNDNALQLLYTAQEVQNVSADALTTADGIATTAATALSTAQSAVTTANAASATANGIAATANTALSQSTAAVNTANGIAGTANTALSTANAASAAATNAVNTANAAQSTANGIAATANTALSNSSTALSTANAALPAAGGTLTGNVNNTSTGFFDIPAGTTAQRPGSPNSGMVRFNTDTNQFEGYGNAWGALGGGATGASGNQVFYENDQTVSASYTITAGKNAVTAGPITIGTGITVTVPSGSSWSIV